MNQVKVHTFILTSIILIIPILAFAGTLKKNNLKILEVKFEPIRQGKNAVRVKVQNTSEEEQIFRLQIYTRSPNYGRDGMGWGTSFFDTITANETKWIRFVFKIQGPITNATYIRLDFHNPGPAASFDREKYFQKKDRKKWFKRIKYSSSDIKHYKADESLVKPAPKTKSEAVIQTFLQMQNLIRDEKYEEAWRLFTNDYQDAEFQLSGLENFKRIMNPSRPIDSAFWWEKDDFLNLQPKTVTERDGVFTLETTCEDQSWTIDFVHENSQWKIDWIAGYRPRILGWQNWEERLLPKMEKHSIAHFDIYYFKDSTAEKEIDKIANQKEKGLKQICQFLGKDSDVRIRVVLFESRESKHQETGHQGMGWAFGNTIVEVYNSKEQLDPYHETTHILINPYGNPPALFNEGFAVYISELLGAYALEDLSGGQLSIYERTRELKNKSEWIDLQQLITYTEIGSLESRPPISYPEAAAFVKFLIDKYGKDKFFKTYKTLKNSNKKAIQQQNIKKLQRIYGKSLAELENEWENTFSEDKSDEKQKN